MKKLLVLGFLSMFGASQAQAGFISIINGADMAGIEVTATFSDMTPDETFTWAALTADSGGVTGTGWSLSQEGETFGEYDTVNSLFVGEWTIDNHAQNLESLFINLLDGFVFDTAFGVASANGSGPGVDFDSGGNSTAMFSGLVQDELFSGLTLTNIAAGGQSIFLTDTDAVVVSAPATVSILMLSLLGLVMNSRRKQA